MGISIRAYAKHRGVSHNAVWKAIQARRITAEPDGSIDIERADKDWLVNTRNPQLNIAKTAHPEEKKLIPVPKSATDAVRHTLANSGQPLSDDQEITYRHAKDAAEISKVELMRLEIDERKGKLVDYEKGAAHVFQMARQIRDAWQNWPMRIANEMAATLGIDSHTLQITLEEAVRVHLTQVSNLNFDFVEHAEPEQANQPT